MVSSVQLMQEITIMTSPFQTQIITRIKSWFKSQTISKCLNFRVCVHAVLKIVTENVKPTLDRSETILFSTVVFKGASVLFLVMILSSGSLQVFAEAESVRVS